MQATETAAKVRWWPARVCGLRRETPRVRTLFLTVDNWLGHLPGQHVDIRLTAADGYQASRSYSIASPPLEADIALTIERVEGGEVSEYLVETAEIGDEFEIRGPIGGSFVWEDTAGRPLWLIAGGSGIVPLMAMLRQYRLRRLSLPVRLLYSSRALDDIIYRRELDEIEGEGSDVRVIHALTREVPSSWSGRRGRIDKNMLAETGFKPKELPLIYICGPTGLVETVSQHLLELGHDPSDIRTERFGPTSPSDR